VPIRFGKTAATAVAAMLLTEVATAQSPPTPGPTRPPITLPAPKPGDNIVINPTIEQCQQGWRPGLKWTKQQFDEFCAQFKISK
jgi:hypothetical protein